MLAWVSFLANLLIYMLVLYLIILALMVMFPYPLQPLAMYLHWVAFPLFVDWDKGGERFGFRAGAVEPLRIKTYDDRYLGVWHIRPRRDICSSLLNPSNNQDPSMKELKSADIVFLYFHGNAGNRATYHRTSFYKILTGLKQRCHVIAIDYRGFGNSSNEIPTEETLGIDAISAFKWILSQGVDESRIVIIGHSLGSGVATHLAHQLTITNPNTVRPFGGLILASGYSSIADAAIGYPNVPLLRPFHGIRRLEDLAKSMIKDKLQSHIKLGDLKPPILILHGKKDTDIRPWQAKANFLDALAGRLKRQILKDNHWSLRNPELPFETKDVEEIRRLVLEGEEGELWTAEGVDNHLWLLLASWGSHNDLAIHHIVHDTIQEWIDEIIKDEKSVDKFLIVERDAKLDH